MVGLDINVVLKQLEQLREAVARAESLVKAAYAQGFLNGALTAGLALIAAYLLTERVRK